MPTWPSTLPQSPQIDFTIVHTSNVIQTEFDSGNIKKRRRFSKNPPKRYNIRMVMNGAQKDIFETFFYTTLSSGVLSFTTIDFENFTQNKDYIFESSGFQWNLLIPADDYDKTIWETSFILAEDI